MRARWFEPIDFAALAIERSKKGWRPTPAQKAAWAKKRKAARRAKGKAAADRLAKARPKRQATPGASQTFLATFQPGCWYGLGDLIAASGLKRGTVHGLAARFWKKGTLTRTKNPAFERPGWMEPEWLYQLNPQVQNQVADQEQGGGVTEDE
jgi:hypothetical protein